MTQKRAIIIVAGGTGTRMGGNMPKQFLLLAHKPVMVYTVEAFLRFDAAAEIVVVMYAAAMPQWMEILEAHFSAADRARIRTCVGGDERTDSVHRGLLLLQAEVWQTPADGQWVAIHDAVRPFVHHQMLQQAFDTANAHGSAVCAVPVKASLRVITPTGSHAVERSVYREVQTPQIFPFAELLQCYNTRPHNRFTDDASLYESFGYAVTLCEGSYDNIKLTTPEDIYIGEQLLGRGL